MSTVRSVSGLAVDVLKLEPFPTVNHWPFLKFAIFSRGFPEDSEDLPLNDQFALPKVS